MFLVVLIDVLTFVGRELARPRTTSGVVEICHELQSTSVAVRVMLSFLDSPAFLRIFLFVT